MIGVVGAVTFWATVEEGDDCVDVLDTGGLSVSFGEYVAAGTTCFTGFPVKGRAGGLSNRTFFVADQVTRFSIMACAAARITSSS
jgi:hypothetical protein